MTNLNELFGLSQLPRNSYEFGGKAYTTQELWCLISDKMNVIIEHFNYLDSKFNTVDETVKQKLDYLLGEGLSIQVSKKLIELTENGTLKDLINVELFQDLNENIKRIETELNSKISADISKVVTELTNKINDENIALKNILSDDIKKLDNDMRYSMTKIVKQVQSVEELKQAIKDGFSNIEILEGTYLIDETLHLEDYTTLKGIGKVTIKRSHDNVNALVMNKGKNISGYENSKNIIIENITFDGEGASAPLTMVAFGHSKNVTIRKCSFTNLNTWHMIELNGVYNGIIEQCYFTNYNHSEAIQIDFMMNNTVFPWGGFVYDDTVCNHIIIRDNTFSDIHGESSCIGNHSFKINCQHKNIFIKNNTCINVGNFVTLSDADGMFIENNYVDNATNGIVIDSKENNLRNVIIKSNFIRGTYKDTTVPSTIFTRAISINGYVDATAINVKITDNTLTNFGGHLIAITSGHTYIQNNVLSYCGMCAIYIYGGYYGYIDNNIIYSHQLSGVSYPMIKLGGNSKRITQLYVVDNYPAEVTILEGTTLECVDKNNKV